MTWLKRVIYRLKKKLNPRGGRTVKYAYSFSLLGVIILSAAAIVSDDTSYIRVETDQTALKAGDQFTIAVYAHAHVPVNTIDIAIAYPAEQIVINNINVGESVITIWAEDPTAADGVVTLKGGTYRKGFQGEHLIAKLKARALTSGLAEFQALEPTFFAGDGEATKIETVTKGEESITLEIGDSPDSTARDRSFTATPDDKEIKGEISLRLATDIDGDGQVTMADIRAFLQAWRDEQTRYDFNNDKHMTFTDFAIILAHFFFRN